MIIKKQIPKYMLIVSVLVIIIAGVLYFSEILKPNEDVAETIETVEKEIETEMSETTASTTVTEQSSTLNETRKEYPKVYYVSNEGDDENSGMSEHDPWKTINKVNSQRYYPRDTILFRRDDVWYEALAIRSSGEEDSPITYANYGDGSLPKIFGSASVDKWSNVEGDIWVSIQEVKDPSMGADHAGQNQGYGGWPGGAWFEEQDGSVTWGSQERYIDDNNDFEELTEKYDWGWFDDHIYIYSREDPEKAYKNMQISQRQFCIGISNGRPQEHIVIDGIHMSYSQAMGFSCGYPEMKAKGLTIRNCEVGYIGIKGGSAAYGLSVWYSDLLIQDNEIHDCGRRGLSYNLYNYNSRSMSFRNVMIENNHFYNGSHTTGIDIANLGVSSLMNFTIRNNYFEGDPEVDLRSDNAFNSNHIYTENNEGSNHSNFDIYNNIFTYCHGKGLAIDGISNCRIYYNTFYGVNPTLFNYQAQLFISGKLENVSVKNNIFYNDADPSINKQFMCISVYDSNIDDIDMDNNLFYTTDPKTNAVTIVNQKKYTTADWDLYKDDTGWDKNSPAPEDPLFVDAPGDLHLDKTSPAINAGIAIPDIGTDHEGAKRQDKPSLGAFESIHE